MSWEIVVGIIALIGVFGTVAGWTSKLSGTLSMLETTIKALNKTLESFQKESKQTHDTIQKQLDDHEKRIVILEVKE